MIVCPMCGSENFLHPVEKGHFCERAAGGCGLGFIFHPDRKLFFWKGGLYREESFERIKKLRAFE